MLLYYSGDHGCLRIWQVAARFIFNAPSSTLDEFTQILFMWMILLGGVYTAGLKKHLAIDLLAQKLSRTPALVLDSIIQVIITVFALIFMVYGGDIIVEKRRTSAKCPRY